MNGLDAYLPSYEFSTRHEVAVEADAERADRALREVTFSDVPLVRALLFARGLGMPRGTDNVVATMVSRASVLEDVPGEGIILSLTGQFWRLRGPEAPATAVVAFQARRGVLATETRVHVPDPVSRRKFERYWRVVRPLSGLIRKRVLLAAKRRAEAKGRGLTPKGVRPQQFDPYELPDGLPVPEDDGAADHLTGAELPDLLLPSSQGGVNVRDFEVLYVYPRTGRPGVPSLPGWDEIPGARGCTPQSCGFRDLYAELGVRVAGISAQSLDDQVEFAHRNRMPFPIISDEWLDLARDPGLPTFEVDGLTLYKRLALVVERGRIVKVFYPVFPADRNAEEVLAWLAS